VFRNFRSVEGPQTLPALGENIRLISKPTVSAIPNPSEVLLMEAMKVFGEHRRVGCLLSCGATPEDGQVLPLILVQNR
jgi:hypothetical protein